MTSDRVSPLWNLGASRREGQRAQGRTTSIGAVSHAVNRHQSFDANERLLTPPDARHRGDDDKRMFPTPSTDAETTYRANGPEASTAPTGLSLLLAVTQ